MVRLGFYAWACNKETVRRHLGLATFSQACRLRETNSAELSNLVVHLLDVMDAAIVIDTMHDALNSSRGMYGERIEDCLVTLETFLLHGGDSALDAYHCSPGFCSNNVSHS